MVQAAEGQLKQLKKKLVAAEANLQEERRQRGTRCAPNPLGIRYLNLSYRTA